MIHVVFEEETSLSRLVLWFYLQDGLYRARDSRRRRRRSWTGWRRTCPSWPTDPPSPSELAWTRPPCRPAATRRHPHRLPARGAARLTTATSRWTWRTSLIVPAVFARPSRRRAGTSWWSAAPARTSTTRSVTTPPSTMRRPQTRGSSGTVISAPTSKLTAQCCLQSQSYF